MSSPNSKRLDDGFASLVEMTDFPDVKLYEKEVQPGGIDGGDKIPTSTMRNSVWDTFWHRSLKTATDINYTAAYADDALDDLIAAVNHNQQFVVTFPDGATRTVWGFMKSFIPQKMVIGKQPEADVVFVPTNVDNSGAEVAPVYTAPPS